MAISIIDMFSIGIGPSSSHTVGPMRAGLLFTETLKSEIDIEKVKYVQIELFGSLGHTGKGHGSDKAVILGLLGEKPEEVDPDTVQAKLDQIAETGLLLLGGIYPVNFKAKPHLIFHRRKSLPGHPNGMKFTAYNVDEELLISKIYYSVGGGFIVNENINDESPVIEDNRTLPYPFTTGDELLTLCTDSGLSISALMLANESAWRTEAETKQYLLLIWKTMQACISKGCHTQGILPGGLKVKRRAAHIYN
ncbi:MAG: L-serine dehydratase, partial [Enterobacterales bacterium]